VAAANGSSTALSIHITKHEVIGGSSDQLLASSSILDNINIVWRVTQPQRRRVTRLWLTLWPRLLQPRPRLPLRLLRPGRLQPVMAASLTSSTRPRQRCALRSVGFGGMMALIDVENNG
jgi:hypothetical protein